MDTVQSLTSIEMSLLRRLIGNGNEPEMAVKTVAMWRWLVSLGFGELTAMIDSRNDEFLASISAEARGVLECVSNQNSEIPNSPDRIFPLTASLAGAPLSNNFPSKDDLFSGVEKLSDELRKNVAEIAKELGSVAEVKALGDLNPNAREWNPIEDSAPEEERCLFLTFSNGYPLAEHQIVDFFTGKFGACVERVYVHYPEGRKEPPLFGKVVFTASSIPAMLLGGKTDAKFNVDRKTLWCKKYDSGRIRSSSRPAASSSRH